MTGSVALGADGSPGGPGVWGLFVDSFDIFSVLLLLGSLTGLAVVFRCVLEIRESRLLPSASVRRIQEILDEKRWDDLRYFVLRDESFVSRTLRPVMKHVGGERIAIREAAELAASEESARWFRRIELLNVIGHLGPLVGLAGTVWGMIIAFTSLGATGGQAGPADLSLGISKALFHTLLGLCLAIPCLLVFGVYRSIVDRLCTRGMMLAGEVVEALPASSGTR